MKLFRARLLRLYTKQVPEDRALPATFCDADISGSVIIDVAQISGVGRMFVKTLNVLQKH